MTLSSTPEQREDRVTLATEFLDHVIIPGVREGRLQAEDILELQRLFQQEHPGSGDDFDIGTVYCIVNLRSWENELSFQSDPESLPPDAAEVVAASVLLEEVINSLIDSE